MDPQQQMNGFGPLPQRRGESAKAFAKFFVIVTAIACVMAVFIPQDIEVINDYVLFSVHGTGRLLLSFVIGKVVQKICLLWEERRHRHTRYNGSTIEVLKSTIALSSEDQFLFSVTATLQLCSFAFQLERATFSHVDYQFGLFCLNSCWVGLLSFAVGCREPPIVEVSRINERENRNVADGLAYGYYFNHLKIVLPELDEKIGESEVYRGRISRKKLYILIPKNCDIPQRIQDADSRVTVAGDLNNKETDQAGSKRVYKFIVHCIQLTDEAEPCYLVLEYASTLRTLDKMSRSREAALSSEQREEQVLFLILLFSFVKKYSSPSQG